MTMLESIHVAIELLRQHKAPQAMRELEQAIENNRKHSLPRADAGKMADGTLDEISDPCCGQSCGSPIALH